MNVLWLAPYPHPIRSNQNHAAPWLTALAQQLAHQPNINLTIVSVSPAIPQTERFTHEGIDFVYVKVPIDKYDLLTGYQRRIRRMRQTLDQMAFQPDVVHIHGSELQYQVMAANLTAPKVLSVQGIMSEVIKVLPLRPDYRHLSWRIAGYYERTYLPTVQHYICRTHWDTRIIREKAPNATIHQNWELMREAFYTPIQPTANPATLLYVGGTNAIKGIYELLVMYNQLSQQLPSMRLVVTGAGNQQELLALISRLRLTNIRSEQIEHRGFLNAQQLWQAYHEAMCLVHPSHIDNSPNSVCEAQLAGLPVIATNVGGVSSLIEHGQTGLLTSIDPTELAEAVMLLVKQPDTRLSMANAARRAALVRHDIHTIVETTCSIYSTVIERKTAPSHGPVLS